MSYWEKIVMAYFKVLFQHLPGRSEKTCENKIMIAELKAKNQKQDLLHRKQERLLLNSNIQLDAYSFNSSIHVPGVI
jgi:hypothetical protein